MLFNCVNGKSKLKQKKVKFTTVFFVIAIGPILASDSVAADWGKDPNRTGLLKKISLANIKGIAPQIYTEPVDPKHTALVLVDIQGAAKKPLYPSPFKDMVDGSARLLAAAREYGVLVVHLRNVSWTHDGSDLDIHKKRSNERYRARGKKNPNAFRLWDTDGSQFHPEVTPLPGELQFWKSGASAFPTTGLVTALENKNIRYLVMVGQQTDGCVLATAVDAIGYGFMVNIVDGATWAWPSGQTAGHLAFMRLFDQHWGRIRTVNEYINEFAGNPEKNETRDPARLDLTQTIDLADINYGAHQIYADTVDPKRTALVIVGMNTDSNEPVTDELKNVIAGCEKLLSSARKNNIKVIHIALGAQGPNGEEMTEYEQRRIKLAAAKGENLAAKLNWAPPYPPTLGKLKPIRGEIMLRASDRSAIPSTGLFGLLHNMGIDYLVFAGRETVGLLGLAAISATSYSFTTTLADGACISQGQPEGHLFILKQWDQCRGRVRTVDELVAEFSVKRGFEAGW